MKEFILTLKILKDLNTRNVVDLALRASQVRAAASMAWSRSWLSATKSWPTSRSKLQRSKHDRRHFRRTAPQFATGAA